jgi:hypothetical protein
MAGISDSMALAMLKAFSGGGAMRVSIDGKEVWGLFDNDSVDSQPGDLIVQSSGPRLTCRTVDVAGVLTRAPVIIEDQDYIVTSNEPDGTGMSLLLLERP